MTQVGRDDIQLLNGIAAFHLRFGRPDQALYLLHVSDLIEGQDEQTKRLMAEAYMALGNEEAAIACSGSLPGKEKPVWSLSIAALAHFRQGRRDAAARLFELLMGQLRRPSST